MKKHLLPVVLFTLAALSCGPVWAEDSETEPVNPKAQELMRLKQKNPEKYQELMQKRRLEQDHKRRHDWDNDPPGPRGGRGTNWENHPGPRGGPGASPDRRPQRPVRNTSGGNAGGRR